MRSDYVMNKNSKQKYFVTDDEKLAILMGVILNQKYYVFDDDKKQGKKIYTFIKNKDTISAYAKAKTIVENL